MANAACCHACARAADPCREEERLGKFVGAHKFSFPDDEEEICGALAKSALTIPTIVRVLPVPGVPKRVSI